jgi:ribonuclease-3
MVPFDDFQDVLGYRFRDRRLLERALTHSSHANESSGAISDNEQLEFLGDAVLGFVTSFALVERYPSFAEGRLSKLRAHLVSAKHLVETARRLGFGEHLLLGRGEERSGGRQKSALLVDALEATVAAMYLDGGIEPARKFILERIVEPELRRIDEDPEHTFTWADQKSALQELLQALGLPQPEYEVVDEHGPDHDKTFTVELRVRAIQQGADLIERGTGRTKKLAEQRAAQAALMQLQRSGAAGVPRS